MRVDAIRNLSQMKMAQSLHLVRPLLEDPETMVREAAERALATLTNVSSTQAGPRNPSNG